MKNIKSISVAICLALSAVCHAETKVFVREYNYQASESDSKLTARAQALSVVKGLLIEELGVYIESYVNYDVEDDGIKVSKDFYTNEIRQLSVGVAETKIIDEQWNGSTYYVKAEITIDPSDVVRRINKSIEERKNDISVDSLQVALEKSKGHIAELEQKLKELEESKAKEQALKTQYEAVKVKIDNYIDEINIKTKLALQFPVGASLSDIEKIMGSPNGMGPRLGFGGSTNRGNYSTRRYGNVWLLFEGRVLYYAVGIESYIDDVFPSWYEAHGVKNLLKSPKYDFDEEKVINEDY